MSDAIFNIFAPDSLPRDGFFIPMIIKPLAMNIFFCWDVASPPGCGSESSSMSFKYTFDMISARRRYSSTAISLLAHALNSLPTNSGFFSESSLSIRSRIAVPAASVPPFFRDISSMTRSRSSFDVCPITLRNLYIFAALILGT